MRWNIGVREKDSGKLRVVAYSLCCVVVNLLMLISETVTLVIGTCFLLCARHTLFCFFFQVLNVQVPFLFKLAVDWLTAATGNAGAIASNSAAVALFATPAAVLIGYGIARSGASAFNGIY